MFAALHDSIFSAVRFLRGRARLTEANMREGLEMVRQSLLEADVALPVVQSFMERVSERALGEKVMKLLDPTEQLISIVKEELNEILGADNEPFDLKKPVAVVMLCGLQGSGKTTTCGKLASWLIKRERRPMLVAADLQRPAAIDQLETLGKTLGIPVHADRTNKDPVAVCRAAVELAKKSDVDVIILDTAGRLHIDAELMTQLSQIESQVQPDHVLFVVDAMTGQDAVRSAQAFHDALDLDGIIMTKLDGDTRGGAALSVRKVTGVPIRFVGTGEVMDALEEFHPSRMVSRILGMGDMLTLIEQAHEKLNREELEKSQSRLMKGEFTLDDFRSQMTQARRLGSFSKILSFMPGFGQLGKLLQETQSQSGTDFDAEMRRVGGIIDAMTPNERRDPRVIDTSRRTRIARGAGCEPHEVSKLIKSFLPMADMMRSLSGGGMSDMSKIQTMLAQAKAAVDNPTGHHSLVTKKGTGKRLTPKERAEAKKRREKEKKKKKK
ncbi:MAG: signal recognition particle protein [Thermoguttaceae bacterium]